MVSNLALHLKRDMNKKVNSRVVNRLKEEKEKLVREKIKKEKIQTAKKIYWFSRK